MDYRTRQQSIIRTIEYLTEAVENGELMVSIEFIDWAAAKLSTASQADQIRACGGEPCT